MGKALFLEGQKFGKLTVIRRYEFNNKYKRTQWVCKCDCGNEKEIIVQSIELIQEKRKTCGCSNPNKDIDLTNKKFNALYIKKLDKIKKGKRYWVCECNCGNIISVDTNSLISGHTKSCGRCKNCPSYQHGFARNSLFSIYHNMIDRCYNLNHQAYSNYGARGIIVCDEWKIKNDYQGLKNFINWAETKGYKKGLTIERINVNGIYEPNNCMWITKKEQARNRRDTIYVFYKNETWKLVDLISFLDLESKSNAIVRRIKRNKMTIEDALFKPIRKVIRRKI